MAKRVDKRQNASTETGLVERCRRGEPDAWPEFVRRFAPYVYAIAVRGYRLGEHDAEDVFQDVFLRAWTRIGDLRDDAAVRPWLGQLTRRLAIDRLRARARETVRADLDTLHDVRARDALDALDDALTVRDAIAQLPGMHREIVNRFFVEGQSHATIAADLGIPEGTVASRICRARQRLRVQLTS